MIVAYVFAAIGIVFAFLSVIFKGESIQYSDILNSVSTIISLALCIVSIVYTFVSGTQTAKTLKNIKEQNEALVEKIKNEMCKNNFDRKNIENVLKD